MAPSVTNSGARDVVKATVREKIELFGSANKA